MLAYWLTVLPIALHHATGYELEYILQFAEADGFHHVTFHLIARTTNWNPTWKGPAVMNALGVDEPVGSEQVTHIANAVGS